MSKISFSAMWSDALGKAIDARSNEPYPLEFYAETKDYKAFADAVNQGIDSHLQAIDFKKERGFRGRPKFIVSPACVSVLVRRLMESQNEHAESLANGICYTLGIELI